MYGGLMRIEWSSRVKSIVARIGLFVLIMLAIQGVWRLTLDRPSLPHAVHVDRPGVNAASNSVDPARIIPQACGNDEKVRKLLSNGWDIDKTGRKYQDYRVTFAKAKDRSDVARLYLDDATVRCP